MNRRGFIASLVALAVAPAVKVEPVVRIDRRWLGPPFKGVECGYVPEMKLTRAQAEELFKLSGNFTRLKAPSYSQGGIVPKVS